MVSSVTWVSHFDVDNFSEDEELLARVPLADVFRHSMARAVLDAEEESAAVSTRPTIALHAIGPWR